MAEQCDSVHTRTARSTFDCRRLWHDREERHRHRYEVNNASTATGLEQAGLKAEPLRMAHLLSSSSLIRLCTLSTCQNGTSGI